MAIVGYQSQLERLDARIAALQAQLGRRGPGRPTAVGTRKRTMSAAGRKAISEAARKRWAAFHKAARAAQKAA